MHLAENTVYSIVQTMTRHMPPMPEEFDPQKSFFLLMYRRQLSLCENAVRLARQSSDAAPPIILLRSALECSIDMQNLVKHEKYHLVLRAIELDNRNAVFRYKSEPVYSLLIREAGEEAVEEMAKTAQQRLKETLEEASRYFPILQNQVHRLTVVNRFRIADKEELYQTKYTTLSMATHNALSMMALQEELHIYANLDRLIDEQAVNMALEFLMEAVKLVSKLFGTNEEMIEEIIELLQTLQNASPRLPD